MGRIIVLDNNMVNMIAAGEVIERPASVAKELLENSIDAGATEITVRVEDGGRKLICVTDNGCGMDAQDLACAFEPHATSKIKTPEDLVCISTMGFRGEALASIASVSRVAVVSGTAEQLSGHCLEIDCGTAEQVRPAGADRGTTMEVRDLFYRLPARKKFLRTANTEMSHISEQFTRTALALPAVGMTLIHNNRQLHRLPAGAGIKERIALLFGRGMADGLIETHCSEKGLEIYALIGRPDAARASAGFGYLFLNRRFIRDKFISHAVREAYRGMIEPGRFPVFFLFIEMPPDSYDVNVHPTKIEVRFQNPNLVHSQVLAVLREKLLASDLDVSGKLHLPARQTGQGPAGNGHDDQRHQRILQAMDDFFSSHKSGQAFQKNLDFKGRSKTADSVISTGHVHTADRIEPATQTTEAAPAAGKYIQLHNSYIVCQTEEGFIIVDQHALHERIIYEQLCRKITEGRLESQRLLIPETFEATAGRIDLAKNASGLLDKLGIELQPFGPGVMAIQAFPSFLGKVRPVEFIRDLLDILSEKTGQVSTERLLHEVLDMAACKAAVKAGQPLNDAEIEHLLSDRDTIERASRCPHGRPTTIKFSLRELEKQFGRT